MDEGEIDIPQYYLKRNINSPQLFIPLDSIVCPITRQLINKIALGSDGQFYEKSAIKRWLKSNKTSPLTGLQMDSKLYACHNFQQLLDNFYDTNPEIKTKRFEKSSTHVDNIFEISKIISDNKFEKLVNFKEYDLKFLKKDELVTLIKNANNNIFAHVIQNIIDINFKYTCQRFRGCPSPTCGKNIVHYICKHGSYDNIKLLVDKEFDLECINDTNNEKPIHYVCKSESYDKIKLLVDKGVDLEPSNKHQCKPIHYTCQYGSYNSIKLLVDNGVDLESVDWEGWKPIHYVCRYRSYNCIKLLVDKGVDLEACTIANNKPIHLVCRYGSYDCIELLVDKEVDLKAYNQNNKKPIDLICKYQPTNIVEMFIRKQIQLEYQLVQNK